jgi:hypothetical protein
MCTTWVHNSVPVTKEKYDLDFPDGPGTRPHATGLHAAIGKEYVPFFEAVSASVSEIGSDGFLMVF